MKKLIAAAVALAGLGGCIAVPYSQEQAYYGQSYGAPAYYGPSVGVGVGVYSSPRYYGGGYGGGYGRRHWR
jgi:hypothetical protein